ncbi:hypothetical protein [Spiroplasma endosymbiont of Cantharis nigra]|uniref:hypothetical protein n=1 Tax=Spiroplasma endosymbiont of Cantharis nigra TaxID=3066278 RepID=UPI0030CA9454
MSAIKIESIWNKGASISSIDEVIYKENKEIRFRLKGSNWTIDKFFVGYYY